MAKRLDGRVVIVTGGGHGIGKVYCRALAGEGARVVVAEIDGKAADATAAALCAEGAEALAVVTDVADETSTRELARATLERFGRIDVLINNAAVFATIPISRVPLDEISVEEWDRVMAVNLRGVFLACKAVLPAMKARGFGRIINIASGTVFTGRPPASTT
jgi:3-oxoacyl-[acyl-carrier protein] reductase